MGHDDQQLVPVVVRSVEQIAVAWAGPPRSRAMSDESPPEGAGVPCSNSGSKPYRRSEAQAVGENLSMELSTERIGLGAETSASASSWVLVQAVTEAEAMDLRDCQPGPGRTRRSPSRQRSAGLWRSGAAPAPAGR